MDSNYKIEAITILLKEDCTLTKFHPLIPYKDSLVRNLKKLGCITKSDCKKLSEEELQQVGLPDTGLINLFRGFLTMYDINPSKLKEISKLDVLPQEADSFRKLYHLPGVKSTRAGLYYKAGFKSLEDIAGSSVVEILEKTAKVIKEENLNLKVPLVKEVKTHIAVARAFTDKFE